jgi:methyl-accepting chemotaxis protein
MADKSSSKLNHDPLAWLNEEEDIEASYGLAGSKDGRKQQAQIAGSEMPISLLEESFALLAPQGEELAERFYARLFADYPEVEPLFANVSDFAAQQKKLLASLKLVVSNLRQPAVLQKALAEMGRRHQGYGVVAAHYPAVVNTLVAVMAEMAGDAWSEELASAWSLALRSVADMMIKAYRKEEGKPMAASTPAAGGNMVTSDLKVLTDILEYSPLNIMMCDVDENIVFVNRKAREVLTGLEDELQKYLPGFRVSEVVGGSIHRYHRDPDAIRRILHAMRPGEVRHGAITPGPFYFEHETRLLTNAKGERVGFVVQWQDKTESRKKEEQAQRLQRAVDQAQTAMMTIDRNLVITYVNEATKKIMSSNAKALASVYPGVDFSNMPGICIDVFHRNPAHQRALLADPNNLPYETDIHVGPLVFHIRVNAIRDLKNSYVGCTLEWSDVTELRRSETNVARLQSALTSSETAIMMCDDNLTITYMNPAVIELLENRKSHLRKVFPGFEPARLIGRNIDDFHQNPAHQRGILQDPTRLPYKGEVKLLDLVFEVNATAILDQKGQYMGNMVEWRDVTEQKDAERQIQSLIEKAAAGNLDERIGAEHYQGFMHRLASGINQLMDAVVMPLRATSDVIQSLAEGDLTRQVEGEFDGEFGLLSNAVNESINNLNRMVGEILEAARSISSASSEIAQGNTDLSQRTEEQASSLEETASSMEELTSTVRQNADNARQANQLAANARGEAEKGGSVADKTISAMAEINASSKKIADIIGVIDEIAFQTNLLALNAAVEAARAGEQGRGFAVVAAEVRNLAQRSASAAKEIKSLIKDSVDKVDEGTKLVNESGRSLEMIVSAVKKVSDIIAEIAAASQEQSAGIEEVNKAVMQMDEMTQQNAALVEEAAAASESLEEQARGLTDLMQFFRRDEGEVEEAAPAHRSSARHAAAPAARAAAPQQRPAARRKPAAAPPARAAARPARQAPSPAASGDDDEWLEF